MSIDSKDDPRRLGIEMLTLGAALHEQGELLWTRSHDWTRIGTPCGETYTKDELDALADERLEAMIGDSIASRYQTEVMALLRRLESDTRRLSKVFGIICPEQPRRLTMNDVALSDDGGCVSCFRDGGYFEPVAVGQYRDACRWCGDWRATNNRTWPPVSLVRWRHNHPGKKVPLSIAQKAKGA